VKAKKEEKKERTFEEREGKQAKSKIER
jgi:hypothetical protein